MVIRKGSEGRHVIMILSTQGLESGKYMMTIPMSYAPGTVAMDVLSCVNHTVDSTAQLTFEMEGGEPRVLFPVGYLGGSGLCGFEEVRNGSVIGVLDGVGGSVRWKAESWLMSWSVVALVVPFLM